MNGQSSRRSTTVFSFHKMNINVQQAKQDNKHICYSFL